MRSNGTLEEILLLLRDRGWEPDGQTRSETVRIPTARSPVYGGIGGELATFGGRIRLKLPGTNWKVTCGMRTLCTYQVVDHQAVGGATYKTRDPVDFLAWLDTVHGAA
jgi:hypothetical protein